MTHRFPTLQETCGFVKKQCYADIEEERRKLNTMRQQLVDNQFFNL